MNTALKILILEDNPVDAEIIKRFLTKEKMDCTFTIASNKKTYMLALDQFQPDIILSDHSLPQFDSLDALNTARKKIPGIPFIMVTGSVSEDFASNIIKAGADDYILKDRINRLPAAIDAALKQRRIENEKQEALEKLIQSEEKYRTIFLKSPLPKWIFDSETFRFLEVNEAAIRHYGYTKEEFLNMTIKDIRPKEDVEFLLDDLSNIKEDLSSRHGNWRHLKKNGELIIVETTAHPIDYNNRKARMVIVNDVTEKIKAEQKILQSETNLRAIFENTSEGFLLLDRKGIVKALNKKAAEYPFFVTKKELQIGDSILNFIAPARISFFKEVISKVLLEETIYYDVAHDLGDGKTQWVDFSVTPVREAGQVTGVCITGRDITERKIAEQQKEFDSNNLKALINNTGDLMWSVDRNLKLITFNDSFKKLIELSIGRSFVEGDYILSDKFTEDQVERYKILYQRALSGETFTIIDRFEIPSEIWSEISFYPIRSGGEIIGTACFSRDITERKIAENKLRLSNERYQAVAKATSDGIWDYDFASGKTYIAGTGYKYLFGYNIINEYSEDFFWESHIHPDDRPRVLKLLAETIADNSKTQAATEYRFLKADGSYAYINDRFFIMRQNGKPIRMLGAKQDITVQKKAEEELEKNFYEKRELAERMSAILNTLPANIALLDEKGILVDVNDSWRNFADDNGFIGSNYGIADNYLEISKNAFGDEKEDGKKVARGISAVLKRKLKEFVFEYPCHSPKIKRWFRMVATPLHEKEYAGAVVMHIDISELRRLEQERLEAKLEEHRKITLAILQGQEKERNHIGQELHDNINQILAGTKLYLGMAGKKSKAVKELIRYPMELIDTSIEEIRLLCSKMVTPLKNIDLQEMVKDLLNKLEQNSITKTTLEFAVTGKVISDDLKLNIFRIIQELINNIVKYADAKNVSISVTEQNKTINIIVSDDGKGFDIKQKRKGIGISNMINRVETFNGEITIESSTGNGSRTNISIPY